MSNLIQIFAKAPIAGHVKTRIAQEVGDALALQIHQRLCEHSITMAKRCTEAEVEVWTTDESALPYFEAFGVAVHVQQGQSLGTRMDFALRHGLARHGKVVIIGADALSLSEHYLSEAFAALQSVQVVVGPATDGGYVLVGGTDPLTPLFREMPWGTPDVMGLTLERLLMGGFNFQILADRWDIDTLQDLQQHAPHWLEELAVPSA